MAGPLRIAPPKVRIEAIKAEVRPFRSVATA